MRYAYAMPGLLLLLSWLICTYTLVRAKRQWRWPWNGSWLPAALLALLVVQLLVIAGTELLSSQHWLTLGGVAAWWITINGLWLLLPTGLHWAPAPPIPRLCWPQRFLDRALLTVATLLLVWLAVQVVVYPPNNWDSMTYHLARVAQWAQRGTVAHYPTHVLRQLGSAPGSEYAMLHLYLLGSGTDVLVQGVQWLALLGTAAGAALVLREWGADTRLQAVGAALVLGTPAMLLQGSSSQNDLFAALWLMLALWALLRFQTTHQGMWVLVFALALGVGVHAKSTVWLFATPLVLWMLVTGLRSAPWRLLRWGLAGTVGFILINASYWWRNWLTFANPLGGEFFLVNRYFGLEATVGNAVRLFTIHVQSNWLHKVWDAGVRGLYGQLGWNINDACFTFGPPFQAGALSRDEDFAGNMPILFILMVIGIWAMVGKRRNHPASPSAWRWLGWCILGAVLLFCGYLKWQIWHGRLTLPLFALLAPWLAWYLWRIAGPLWAPRAALLLLLYGVGYVAGNVQKPLRGLGLPREQLYFVKRPDLAAQYLAASKVLKQGAYRHVQVELDFYLDGWLYPLYPLSWPAQVAYHYPTAINRSVRYSDSAPVEAVFHAGPAPPYLVALPPRHATPRLPSTLSSQK